MAADVVAAEMAMAVAQSSAYTGNQQRRDVKA
jgi:hypothetical protein